MWIHLLRRLFITCSLLVWSHYLSIYMDILTSLAEWSYLCRVSLSGGQLIPKKLAGHSNENSTLRTTNWGTLVARYVCEYFCRIYIYIITWRIHWQYAYQALADALYLNRSLVRVSIARNGLIHERSRCMLGVIFFCISCLHCVCDFLLRTRARCVCLCVLVCALLFNFYALARAVCAYTHTHTHTHIFTRIYIFIYTYMHICIYVCTYAHMHIYIHACTYVHTRAYPIYV